ncbi:FkbM family methyltransferase [Rosistilla ulvae]|uniref:FkbM family methyltransferase n=1 Tax=Rosistilla ulvae TaxID=1930277 RepID=UPI001C54D2F6|nr:FkbM family methyltransferase [Rosistilla ulvae]
MERASFDRNHLLKHGAEPAMIYSEIVQCMTFHEMLEKEDFDTVDLLQIDAEGYDYEIIKTIDFNRLAPSILRFEYRPLSNSDLDECLIMLGRHEYRFIVEDLDPIASR